MTKRLKVYLLIAFAAAGAACTLAGCKIGRPGRAEILAGYDSHVTYYSNGGSFNDSSTTTVMEIYYKAGNEGVPFFNVTNKTREYGLDVVRRGYNLIGWYEPERYTAEDKPDSEYVEEGDIKFVITYVPDANGNIPEDAGEGLGETVTEAVFPLKNSNGSYIVDSTNDRPVFARMNNDGSLKDEQILEARVTAVPDETKLVAGFNEEDKEVNNLTIMRDDSKYVCAAWERAASIRYNLIVTDENGNVLADADKDDPTYYKVFDNEGNEVSKYKNEDAIDLLPIHGDTVTPLDRAPLEISGLTFVRTYMDKALTERVHSIPKPEKTEKDKDPIVDVYCRYVLGDWTVVTAKKVIEVQADYESRIKTMFSGLWNADSKYLIIDDIDCTGFSAFPLKKIPQSGNVGVAASNATIVVAGSKALTISNLSFAISGDMNNWDTYSIFGRIGESFKVTGAGLILKNTTVTLASATKPYNFYAICEAADTAASANVNLTIDTVTVTYQLAEGGMINGMQSGGTVTHWMFGGAASDQAFLTQFTGIKLASGDNSSISEYVQQPEQQD